MINPTQKSVNSGSVKWSNAMLDYPGKDRIIDGSPILVHKGSSVGHSCLGVKIVGYFYEGFGWLYVK